MHRKVIDFNAAKRVVCDQANEESLGGTLQTKGAFLWQLISYSTGRHLACRTDVMF